MQKKASRSVNVYLYADHSASFSTGEKIPPQGTLTSLARAIVAAADTAPVPDGIKSKYDCAYIVSGNGDYAIREMLRRYGFDWSRSSEFVTETRLWPHC